MSVQAIIADQLGLDTLPADNATIADLGADRLDALELTLRLEDEFSISITDDEAAAADTVGKCVLLVVAKVAARGEQVVL